MHNRFFSLLLVAGFSFGATYHVNPDGSDEGSGPFRTIQYAISQLVAGDELIIADGVYRERGIKINRAGTSAAPITIKGAPGSRPIIDLGLAVTGWTLQENGVFRGTTSFTGDDAPHYVEGLIIDTTPLVKVASIAAVVKGTYFVDETTVYAWPPAGQDPRQHHSTLLVGSDPGQQNSAGAPSNRPAISITSTGHLVFENIIVQGGYFNFWPNTWGSTRGRNITLRNVTARYSIKMAIRTDGYDDITIDNCDIYHAGLWNIRRLGDRGWPHAVIGYNSDRFVIKNSRIHDNHGEGIGPFLSCRDWHMHDNVVWDNWGINIYFDTQMGFSSAERNIVFGTDRYELTAKSGSLVHIAVHNENADLNWGWPDNSGHAVDSIIIANNIVLGAGISFRCFPYNWGPSTYSNILVANNTFQSVPLETENQIRIEKGSNFRFVNNIVTTGKMWIANGVDEGITVSHNILPTTNPNNNQTNITISNNLAVDPLFTLTGSALDPDRYRLKTGSPAIGYGLVLPEVSDDFYGNPRNSSNDLGAIAYSPPVSGGAAISDTKRKVPRIRSTGDMVTFDGDDGSAPSSLVLLCGAGRVVKLSGIGAGRYRLPAQLAAGTYYALVGGRAIPIHVGR